MQNSDSVQARVIVVKSNMQLPHPEEGPDERGSGDRDTDGHHHRPPSERFDDRPSLRSHRDFEDERPVRRYSDHDDRWEEPSNHHRGERRRRYRSRSRSRSHSSERGHTRDERSCGRRSRSPRDRNHRYRPRDERPEDDEREDEKEMDRARAQPTTTVYIRNLPYYATEVDLYSFIWERFTVVDESRAFSFRLGRDEATGRTKGSAFIDFEHLEASKAFVELCDGQGLFFPKKPFINPDPNPGYPPAQLSAGAGGAEDFIRLRVEFSQNLPRPQNEVVPATSNKVPVLDDWLCLACNVLNFARRHECFQCSAPRMPDSQVVKSDRGPMKRPTSCLCIQGSALASIDEDRIRRLFSGQAAVTDVRLIRDKRNKAGVIAYVRYGSVAEAARALSLLQGVVPSGSSSGLNLAFSRDVFKGESSGLESNHSLRQAADATNTWQPKEFGSDDGGGGGGWEPKAFNEAKDEEPQATVVKAESSQATSSGFVLDPASGYYYDAKSGYYYDPKTSLYYHSSTKHWYQFNQSTGEYKAVTTQASTTSASAPSTTYAPNPDPTPAPKASEQVAAEKVAVPAEPSAPVTKKASAVIGAAPQLNPGGLLLAAIQMDEKAKAKLKMESAPVPVPSAPIQGVIHKGKWANKKKQEAGVKD